MIRRRATIQFRDWTAFGNNLFTFAPPNPCWSLVNGIRPVHDALASAGARSLRRPPLGSPNTALGRRAGLFRSLDRRASPRARGAAPVPRPADRASADGDEADPARAGWLLVAVPSPGRTGEPGGDARSSGAGPAQFRGRRQRPA